MEIAYYFPDQCVCVSETQQKRSGVLGLAEEINFQKNGPGFTCLPPWPRERELGVMPRGLKLEAMEGAWPSLEYCHLYCLTGHLTTLSEAKTHTQLTSAKCKIITVEFVVHAVGP